MSWKIYAEGSNVALASSGAKATSSGDFVHPKHKLLHINDGRHGNDRSWIVDSAKGGWVQIELAAPTVIDRIVWGRDRNGQYADRLPIEYRIESAWKPTNGSCWRRLRIEKLSPVASPSEPDYQFAKFPAAEAMQGEKWLKRLQTARDDKEGTRKVDAGLRGYVFAARPNASSVSWRTRCEA